MFVSSLAMAVQAPGVDLAQEAPLAGDIQVRTEIDAGEQSGRATAAVRIHAPREVVWSLITSCKEALNLIPGLVGCDVLETAPDGSWQRVRHVMNYSWFVPKLTYEIHVAYDPPTRVSVERIAGDLKTLNVSWTLESDGDYTVAHYGIDLAPGFWVPHWLVRSALRHDLPTMLHALRARAESLQKH